MPTPIQPDGSPNAERPPASTLTKALRAAGFPSLQGQDAYFNGDGLEFEDFCEMIQADAEIILPALLQAATPQARTAALPALDRAAQRLGHAAFAWMAMGRAPGAESREMDEAWLEYRAAKDGAA